MRVRVRLRVGGGEGEGADGVRMRKAVAHLAVPPRLLLRQHHQVRVA